MIKSFFGPVHNARRMGRITDINEVTKDQVAKLFELNISIINGIRIKTGNWPSAAVGPALQLTWWPRRPGFPRTAPARCP